MSGYKTICPVCGGNDFYVTPQNGVRYCFSPSCNYYERDGQHTHTERKRSDNIDDIRAFYKQAAHYYHSALNRAATDYLYQRGFTDATIQELQIGYCPVGKSPLYKQQIAKEAGLAYPHDDTAFLANRITFPYFYDTQTITEIRGRSLDPYDDMKYKSPFGSTYYRGADYPYNYHLCNASRIIITEGEIKADLAVQIGYPTIALPGMGIWKQGFRQRENQEVIILFDSQRKNRHTVRSAIMNAASKILDPKIATLPLFGADKIDIDDFILRYGKTGFDTVINGALTYHTWLDLQRF